MSNTNKPLATFQRLKAYIRKTLFYRLIFHPIYSLKRLTEYIETKDMNEDERYFYLRNKAIFGYKPDFKSPKTFNEKLIYRTLYDRKPIYSILSDKLKMRIYVAHKLQGFTQNKVKTINTKLNSVKVLNSAQILPDAILAPNSPLFTPIDMLNDTLFATNSCEFLPKLYGIWKSVDKIDFDKLPNAFVLKVNHLGNGNGIILVPNKKAFLMNEQIYNESMRALKKCLKVNAYYGCREWHYKDIEPRVFAEEFLTQDGANPTTYKFHIFGKDDAHNFIQVTTERFGKNYQRVIMDYEWQLAPFGILYDNTKLKRGIPHRPSTLKSMKNISYILAEPFAYVRVDLYNIDSTQNYRVVVGELTWCHGGAKERFVPNEYDEKIGNLWRIKDLQC